MEYRILAATMIFLMLLPLGASTSFGTADQKPLPNVTEITLHDVTGLTPSQKEVEGQLEASGLNSTFQVEQENEWRQYRVSFRIRNDGNSTWQLNESDELYHIGINESWQVDKIWYNITQDYDGGSFENGKVVWNTSKGGSLDKGETMYAKYLVNSTVGNSVLLDQRFEVNDTNESAGSYDIHELDLDKLGFINLTLNEPPEDAVVVKDEMFSINSTVSCENGECGNVEVSARYNQSNEADTVIPEDSGTPFYVNSSNPSGCGELKKEEVCHATWYANATGDLETWHRIDVNASSNSVSSNQSGDQEIQINRALLFDLSWDTTRFGLLEPGADNSSAKGNSDLAYNLTVDGESEKIDNLWIRSTPLGHENTDYSIPAENMSYHTAKDISGETFFSEEYQLLERDLSPGSRLNLFFWIDVPSGILKGDYNGTYYFKANSTR